jgi:hypothetical protein
MSTANFWNFKSDYIYVPKDCSEFVESEEEAEFEAEIVEEDIKGFLQDLKSKLNNYTYKDYDVVFIEESKWKNRDVKIIARIVIEGYNEKEEFIDFEIEILRAGGYYWGVNIDYDYDEHKLSYYDDEKDFMKVFLHIIQVLENTLYDHFDRFSVIGRASSGETFYKKL